MDKKELLLKLCRELTERVENLYRECEIVLRDVGGTAQWVDRKHEEELLWSIDRGHKALEKSRLKELSWEIRRLVEEGVQDKEEGKERWEGKGEDRKALLLRLFKEFYDVVDYLYGDGLYAHLGERLMWCGSMLSKVGWILVWGEEQDREKMFKVIEDTFQKKHMLKCSWEEWLDFKLRDIEEEIDRRMYPEEREEQNPEPQTRKPTDELPF